MTRADRQAARMAESHPDAPGRPECRLENWHTEPRSPYRDPREPSGIVLHGLVYGHPSHRDGEEVTTGGVYHARGRHAYGRRTVYLLGEADPKFVAWCAEQKIPFDPENPIRYVGDEELAARERGGVKAIPDLRMKPPTHLGNRMLVLQSLHSGHCPCPCCRGTATLGDVQNAEAAYPREQIGAARVALGLTTHGGRRAR